jgi:serine kinase of HPr protein (carbohydrate metabolism regulator)
MKVSELIENLNLTLVTDNNYEDREVKGCYIGDLLSWVMGRAQADNVWITIMNNINIVAVAALADVACILLCEDVKVDQSIIDKANSQNIIIVSSKLTAFELAEKLAGKV